MFLAKLVLFLFFAECSQIQARYIMVQLSDNIGGRGAEDMDFPKMAPENQNMGSASEDALTNVGRLMDEGQQKTKAIAQNARSAGRSIPAACQACKIAKSLQMFSIPMPPCDLVC